MVVIPRRIGSAGHSDEQLIARCLRGDSGAWDEIVERYGRLVYSIPRRYGMAEQDADDVFQSVFVIAMQKLDTLRDCSRLSSWLITTTHRECWRLGRRPGAMGDLDQTIEDVGSPAPEQVEIWETQHLIHQALSLLGGSCETLLRALFLDGAESDYETIARRLNIKVGSIGPTRARCFGKLERILADLGHEARESGLNGRAVPAEQHLK